MAQARTRLWSLPTSPRSPDKIRLVTVRRRAVATSRTSLWSVTIAVTTGPHKLR
jgi:hypothetical protein